MIQYVAKVLIFSFIALSSCSDTVNENDKNEEIGSFGTDTITLAFVGDIMCHKAQVSSALIDSTYDFRAWFQHIRPIISSADVAFANLETTLSSHGRYSGYPKFISPDELAYAIEDAGFDVVFTANNHSNDNRRKGLNHTIDVLRSTGVYHTGTFKDSLDKELNYPLIVEMAGIKIAVINYTYGANGIPTTAPNVVNFIDTIQIKVDIQKAKAMEPDLVIAYMHWGYQYHVRPNLKQIRMAKMMIREGVDHIIGAHPHVVQPIEIINDGSKDHLVAYSLGNFISNQKKPLTDRGLILLIKLEKGSAGVRLLDWNYIPVWRYIRKEPQITFEVIPTDPFLGDSLYFHNQGQYLEMINAHQYLEDIFESKVR